MGFFDLSRKVKKSSPDIPQGPGEKGSTSSPPAYHQSPPPQQAPQQVPQQVPQQPWQNQGTGQQPPFQPAGYLPPPPNWNGSPPARPPPQPYPYPQTWPPIIVNQHYYLSPPAMPPQQLLHKRSGPLSKLGFDSVVDLADQVFPAANFPQLFDDGLPPWHGYGSQLLNQGAAMYDQIFHRFNDVMTSIDRDRLSGNEGDLFTYQPVPTNQQGPTSPGPSGTEASAKKTKKDHVKDHHKGQTTAVAASVISGSHFAKVELYANSKLPMNLPPLKLYIPTYPLLCLAAQYSERVYDNPKGAERDAHVDADWRTGTKAMVIKSVPMDHMNTIVFAIRGTSTFMDWAVNLNMAPASPAGFLDDPGNFCHAGFLSVARRMIRPVAARLRQLIEEDPGRASYSLLMTGHSAGGAIAALLYCHLLATSRQAESELNLLAGCFRRIHCVTFGTPPVSLLPLATPDDAARRPWLKKSLFLTFLNEGDPVARADKAYVRTLLELFATPAPVVPASEKKDDKGARGPPQTEKKSPQLFQPRETKSKSSLVSAKSAKSAKSSKSSTSTSTGKSKPQPQPTGPVWKVPPCTLSSAGRIVVLRSGDPHARLAGRKTVEERLGDGVVAQVATDEHLRGVIWGDPVCHVMRLYAGRIETLAVGAVTAKGY